MSPGVVTKDAAGEGRWSDRGAGPLTGIKVMVDTDPGPGDFAYGVPLILPDSVTNVSAR